jgi:DNA repair exonuclease SbcCD ATPase subunit
VYKFQVQGARDAPNEPADTWRGARLGPQEVVNLARETACELADFEGLGEQYFWLWFRKGAEAPAPDRSVDLLLAEAARLTAKIEGLAETVAERTAWAQTLDRRINELGAVVSGLRDELERSNKWAESLDQEVQSLRDAVERGQAEIERRTRWAQERDAHAAQLGAAVSDLQSELEERTRWARGLEADVEERTRWARGLEQELNGARSALARIQASLGYRIAARLGLIPRPEPD